MNDYRYRAILPLHNTQYNQKDKNNKVLNYTYM